MTRSSVFLQAIKAIPPLDSKLELAPLNCQVDTASLVCFLGQRFSILNTYMQMLAGLSQPQSGKVLYFSDEKRDTDLPEIAYLHYNNALLSVLNGIDNVKLPALYHQLDTRVEIDKKVALLLNELDYGADHSVLPDFMTTLQKRHLLIARAIILEPKALFIENPFDGLELEQIQLLGNYLSSLVTKKKITLITSNTPLDFVERYADNIICCHPKEFQVFNNWHSFSNYRKANELIF